MCKRSYAFGDLEAEKPLGFTLFDRNAFFDLPRCIDIRDLQSYQITFSRTRIAQTYLGQCSPITPRQSSRCMVTRAMWLVPLW